MQPTSYVNFDLPDVDAQVVVFKTRTSVAACGVVSSIVVSSKGLKTSFE